MRPPLDCAVLAVALHYTRLSARRKMPRGTDGELDALADDAMGFAPGRGRRRAEWIVAWWRGAYVAHAARKGRTILEAARELQRIEGHDHPISRRKLIDAMNKARCWEAAIDGAGWPRGERRRTPSKRKRDRELVAYEAALDQLRNEEEWRAGDRQDVAKFLRMFPDCAPDDDGRQVKWTPEASAELLDADSFRAWDSGRI